MVERVGARIRSGDVRGHDPELVWKCQIGFEPWDRSTHPVLGIGSNVGELLDEGVHQL